MNLLFLLVALLLAAGCGSQSQQPRQYTEINSSAENQLTWDLPHGWKEGGPKPMRLASFYKEDDPDAVDCSIVALPGTAGGVEANLKRWMSQIGIDASEANYHELVADAQTFQTRGGLTAAFYDFLVFQGASSQSMLAAMIFTNGSSIFVKMTGTAENVQHNRDSFLKLLKSLSIT